MFLCTVAAALAIGALTAEVAPLSLPNCLKPTVEFWNAGDDRPDDVVVSGGREFLPRVLPAGERVVPLGCGGAIWKEFGEAILSFDAELEPGHAIEGMEVIVTIRPGVLPPYKGGTFNVKATLLDSLPESGPCRFRVAVRAADIAKAAGIAFPSRLGGVRLLRRPSAPRSGIRLASVDLERRGFLADFSTGFGDFRIADLDRPARCRPQFALSSVGSSGQVRFRYRAWDDEGGRVVAEGEVCRDFADGDRQTVAFPVPDRAGVTYVDYEIAAEGELGYRVKHRLSYAAMHPAGMYPTYFTDEFLFSCLAHFEFYAMNERRKMIALMALMGANHTRAGGYYWCVSEPNGPGEWRGWKKFLKTTEMCKAAHVERHIGMNSPPKWAADPAGPKISFQGPYPRMDEATRYARELSARLKGTVRYFEGNNEPNLTEWMPEWNAAFEKALYKGMKEGNPEARFISGEWGGFVRNWSEDYYSRMNTDAYDVQGIHYHGDTLDAINSVEYFKSVRRKAAADRPWMGDECANCFTNDHRASVCLFQKYIHAWANGAIGMTWYNLRCKGIPDPMPEGEMSFGLVSQDFSPRGTYVAFNALASLYRDAKCDGAASVAKAVMCWRFHTADAALYPIWSMDWKYKTQTFEAKTDARRAELVDRYGNRTELKVRNGRIAFTISEDPRTVRLEPVTAAIRDCRQVAGEEKPSYNRRKCSRDKPAVFHALNPEFYTRLAVSSAENDDLVWRGLRDCSGSLFVWYPDGDRFRIRVAVADDVRKPGPKGRNQFQGDGIQVMLQLPGQAGTWEIGAAWLEDDDRDVFVWGTPQGFVGSEVAKRIRRVIYRRDDGSIWYELDFPYAAMGVDRQTLLSDGYRLNVMINDNDGRMREGFMAFSMGNPKDPENFLSVDFSGN